MSNESTQLTQFQQKAQMRLQEMEVEWRRAMFERFRTICREEMMDVMKTLLITSQNPEALEEKLEALRQATDTRQMELFSSLEQTKESIQSLATKLDEPTKGLEDVTNITKEAAEKQEESTRMLQEDVRKSVQLSRSTTFKAVLITAAICILLSAGAVAALRLLGGSSLVNDSEIKAREQALNMKASAEADLKVLQSNRAATEKEIQDLTARREALLADIRQTTSTQSTLAANLASIQQQIDQLQQLQEQFRFKMVKGEEGGVFVEIPEDAQPFQFEEKTYIQVR